MRPTIAALNAENMVYIWEQPDWPRLTWQDGSIAAPLAAVRHEQGRLIGRMEALGFKLREEAVLHTLTQDVVKTSEIEGEQLDATQVRSSLARKLGIDIGALPPTDRNVEGIVEVMLDATRNFQAPLTKERLFGWHAALFPTGRSGMTKIIVGDWRDDSTGPMQVVSGPYGREKVHYSAPPALRVAAEMEAFLTWFNAPLATDPVIKAALAHLWFVTIHPFEDGNGRIARAIADLALARSEGSSQRFYSMSAQIRAERNAYYDQLERTQKGGTDVTLWILWFFDCLGRAIHCADGVLAAVVAKGQFWERAAALALNERQIKVLNRLLDGFEGKMTSSKWAVIAKCSQDTANRDIAALLELGLLRKGEGGGRNTHYELVL
ncbi:Fic family protein [Tabrizicola fusiformis]|uniref:Fic family protein n=1 Tax=Tabrizicola sp. SY72 TaxID=2741673 RepID=UPI0019D5675D|nr:Fic family protein [Tabrizicola sp. SY72]